MAIPSILKHEVIFPGLVCFIIEQSNQLPHNEVIVQVGIRQLLDA